MSKTNTKTQAPETLEDVTIETPETPAPKFDIAELLETHKTKSGVIRYLTAQGLKRGEIVKVFTSGGVKMIYQHVRNVQLQPLKKA